MKKTIRALASDWGQVIGTFSHDRACSNLSELCCLSPQEIYETLFDGDTSLNARFDCGLSTEAFLQELRDRLGIAQSVTVKSLAAAWSNIFCRTQHDDETVRVLSEMSSSIPVVLASNTNALHFQKIKEGWSEILGWPHVLSFEIGFAKPSREFFDHVVKVTKVSPEEILFIDDRFACASEAFGFQGLHFTAETDLAKELANRGIGHFE